MQDIYLDYHRISVQYRSLKALFRNRRYSEYITEASKILDKYPSETDIRLLRARAYRYLKMYDESRKDLEYILTADENFSVVGELYLTYYKLKMYREALKLQPEIYKLRCIERGKASFCEYVMRQSLGLPIMEKTNDYNKLQVLNYDEEASISHVKDRNNSEKPISKFNPKLDISFLYYAVKENIAKLEPIDKLDCFDTYIFAVPNVGVLTSGTMCNFIRVLVIPGTKNILDIAPIVDVIDCTDVFCLDCSMSDLFGKGIQRNNQKQIEKFNRRYKKA